MTAITVAGTIGTGKSTFVRTAIANGVMGVTEKINRTLLSDYIKEPHKYAFALQTTALHAAVVRLDMALETVRDQDKQIVVERDAYENLIFAVANRDASFMTTDELRRYRIYALEELERLKELLLSQRVLRIYLWAHEGVSFKRMVQRGIFSEQDYDDDYIEHVLHCYFRGVLESMLPLASESVYIKQLPYLVLDWNNYGSWKSTMPALLAKSEEEMKRTEFSVITFVVDPEDAAPPDHPIWNSTGMSSSSSHILQEDKENEVSTLLSAADVGELHLDLSWYETRDIKQYKRGRSAFRDAFFAALARRQHIVFHGKKSCQASLADYRHIYTGI